MTETGLSPEATEVARRRAAEDRDLLARLRREGTVRRHDGEYERRHPEVARPFVRDIEARAFPKREVNLAIRPKKRRR